MSKSNCDYPSKTSTQAGGWGAEEKSEIVAISNKYKNIFNDLMNCLDTESSDWPDFSDWPGLIDKRLRNALRSIGNLSTLLEKDCLDKDILVTSLKPVPKI